MDIRSTLHRFFICLSTTCFVLVLSLPVKSDTMTAMLEKANRGDAQAQYSVGRQYELGFTGQRDYKIATEWYIKSADNGNVEAAYRLGFLYYKGIGEVQKQYKEAFKWFTVAANANHTRAQSYLAELYMNGYGVEQDESKADYWYTKSFKNEFNAISNTLDEFKSEQQPVAQNADKTKPAEQPAVTQVAKVNKPSVVSKKANKHIKATPKVIRSEDIQRILMQKKWTSQGKDSDILSSGLTKCKTKGEKINCMSRKVKGRHLFGLYEFKVKSIISGFADNGEFNITHRRLILKVPDTSVSAYEDEDETVVNQNNAMKVGWENAIYRVPCKMQSEEKIICYPVGAAAYELRGFN